MTAPAGVNGIGVEEEDLCGLKSELCLILVFPLFRSEETTMMTTAISKNNIPSPITKIGTGIPATLSAENKPSRYEPIVSERVSSAVSSAGGTGVAVGVAAGVGEASALLVAVVLSGLGVLDGVEPLGVLGIRSVPPLDPVFAVLPDEPPFVVPAAVCGEHEGLVGFKGYRQVFW